jgi:23S rRNA pseudouridine1911/1915/1917 synthase
VVDCDTNDIESYEFTAGEEAAGERVDRFLTVQLPEVSRARIQRAAAVGALTVNGQSVKPNHRLRPAELVAVAMIRPEPTDDPPQPESIPLDIVHEDDLIIVINKPVGMVVHPATGNRTGTLVNALLGYGAFATGSTAGSGQRPGIVHRLDKGTSGLMVCARTENAHHHLAGQIKERTLTRRYRAVAWGLLNEVVTVIDMPVRPEPRCNGSNGSGSPSCSKRHSTPDALTRSVCICRISGILLSVTMTTAAGCCGSRASIRCTVRSAAN